MKQPIENASSKRYSIYVDGSFIDGKIGFGAVIVHDENIEHEISGSISDKSLAEHRQVGGELYAVLESISWCKENGIAEAEIYYDYIGVEAWPTGKWKANKELTKKYAKDVRDSGITFKWHKVKAHSGDRWNEYADNLAKQGAMNGSSPKGNDKALPPKIIPSKKDDIARKFAAFLEDGCIAASVSEKEGTLYSRVELYDGLDRVGIVDIYSTKSQGLKPDFRGFSDLELKEITAGKWVSFLQLLV